MSWGNLEPPRAFGKLASGCLVLFTRRPLAPMLAPMLSALLCNIPVAGGFGREGCCWKCCSQFLRVRQCGEYCEASAEPATSQPQHHPGVLKKEAIKKKTVLVSEGATWADLGARHRQSGLTGKLCLVPESPLWWLLWSPYGPILWSPHLPAKRENVSRGSKITHWNPCNL